MRNRVLPLFLATVALAFFVAGPGSADDKGDKFEAHKGKVVSVKGTKLIMADNNGKEHTHVLARDAKLMCDGKKCMAEDLKPGMRIRVTTPKNNLKTAVKVEALDRDKDFPKLDFTDLERTRP